MVFQACEYYMARGHFAELIALLESGIGLERAHMGIFTALGEMYANHEPAKLMEHLKLFSTRINIPRLITITDRQMLWKELTFLYEKCAPCLTCCTRFLGVEKSEYALMYWNSSRCTGRSACKLRHMLRFRSRFRSRAH